MSMFFPPGRQRGLFALQYQNHQNHREYGPILIALGQIVQRVDNANDSLVDNVFSGGKRYPSL